MRVWRGTAFRFSSLALVALVLISVFGPARADQPKDAIQSAVGSDQIQRDAPLPERARQSIKEAESEPDIQHDRPNNPPPTAPQNFSISPFWASVVAILPYLILGIIVLGLLIVLARYVASRAALRPADRDKAAGEPTSVSRALGPDEPERDHTFDEVDALAAAGAFTEAVHKLLLLVQGRVKSRIEHGVQVSLTSREILRRARLPSDAATAFATLVAAVEISYFGMQAANAATYQLCRAHSQRVLAAAAG
ncbi:MAG TPA: DUF4129 domain-containing protein [Candidatus Cybelea sp.]|nr:DUF4129 domain-containing protein [Candidatus Cybelea sp.]